MTDPVTDPAAGPDAAPPPRPLDTRSLPLLLWVWRGYLGKGWKLLALALVLMAIEGSSLGFLSLMMQPMFDRVFVGGDTAALAWIAAGISGSFVLRAVASVAHRALISYAGEMASLRMQSDVLTHLMCLDQRFYKTNPPGMLIERVRGDSLSVVILFNGVFVPFGRDAMALLSLVSVALYIDWVWTLVALIGTPLLILPILLLQGVVRGTSRLARMGAASAVTRLDEIFHGIATIHLAGTEAREAGRFRESVRSQIRAQVTAATASAAIPGMMDIVAAVGFAGVLFYGGAQIAAGDKTVGEFMSFFTAMALVFEPLRRLGGVTASLQLALAGLERVRALLGEPVRLTSPAVVTARSSREPGPIVCDDVTFAYETDPVLQSLSFTAAPGRRTALVGRSGAGKTTVFGLLTRMADPQSGRITIGGHDLRAYDLADLRRMFSVVSQEPALFDETLRDNILLGRTDVTPADLDAALDAARVAEFLPRLPQGLDTPVGPRGSALSGGQRQRVAIARALVRNAPILLLDEATSALDAANEALVQEALDRLSAGRTTLVIAHRLATVQGADRILVMDRGQVVDQGTHAELLARGGLYADLCRLQFGA